GALFLHPGYPGAAEQRADFEQGARVRVDGRDGLFLDPVEDLLVALPVSVAAGRDHPGGPEPEPERAARELAHHGPPSIGADALDDTPASGGDRTRTPRRSSSS